MSLPEAFVGTVKVAPVGTDLRDTDSWVDLTSSIESVSFGENKAPNPLLDILNDAIATGAPTPPASAADIRQNVLDMMQKIRDTPPWQATIENAQFGGGALSAFGGGVQLVTSPHVQRGSVYVVADGASMVVPDADYREFTEAEYAAVVARRIVRHGFAEAYSDFEQWDGPVGPAPEDEVPRAFKFFARVMVQDRGAAPWFTHITQRMTDPGEPI